MRMRALAVIAALPLVLAGCGDNAITEVTEGGTDLPDVTGPITAYNAFTIVSPLAHQDSDQPELLLITSGTSVDAHGRSNDWEFVFRLADRSGQAVYSFSSSDPETEDAALRLAWRMSPRARTKEDDPALPVHFVDSPQAAGELSAQGVDWVAGDPDMVLTTQTTPSGEALWTAWVNGQSFSTPFEAPVN